MSSNYAGNPASFPATIPVLDDGDPPEAGTWAPALEGLTDRTANLDDRLDGLEAVAPDVFTSAGGTRTLTNDLTVTTATAKKWLFNLVVQFLGGTLDLAAASLVAGVAAFNNTTGLNGPTTLTNLLALTGNGRVRFRQVDLTTDADMTLGVSSGGGIDYVGDIFILELGILSADRTCTISTAGAGIGSWMLIASADTGNALLGPDIGSIKSASGSTPWRLLVFNGATWRTVAFFPKP